MLDALSVTCPLPLCIIIQLNPTGKLVGTVIVIALPFEQFIIVPLSVAARVFEVPDSLLISAPKPVRGLSLKSVFLGSKYAARVMKKNTSGGSIINTASIAGMGGGSGPLAYSAAKAGVINFCKNAAIELGEFKIRVNAISPGTINTPLLATAIEDSKLEQPIKDFGMPIDIAYSALFLASDESRFITGINLCVDGGLTLDNSGLMVDAAEHYAKMGIERVVGMNMGSTGIESVITDLQDDD